MALTHHPKIRQYSLKKLLSASELFHICISLLKSIYDNNMNNLAISNRIYAPKNPPQTNVGLEILGARDRGLPTPACPM